MPAFDRSRPVSRRRLLGALANFGCAFFTSIPALADPTLQTWQLPPLGPPPTPRFPVAHPIPLVPNPNSPTVGTGHHPFPFALGSDRFIAEEWRALEGRRVGLVTNQTGILSNGETLLTGILRNPNIHLRALYSPEHGLHGNHQAGSTVESAHDTQSNLPIYSLYGATKRPSAEMLADIDVLLFDIQDVGARPYTYISTLALIMQAAAEHGKSVWVLDRPNPIGGDIVEGPVLEKHYSSFIGLYPLPMRHALTIGEMATLYHQFFGINCDLQVIRMNGYTRHMFWPQTHLVWTPTSPNIPYFRTAMLYLTTGPLGASGLINGIGSEQPFEVVLARGLNGEALANMLNLRDLPGVYFEPTSWTPQKGYWKDQRLDGIKILLTHYTKYLSVHTGLEILAAIAHLSPEYLQYTAQFDRDWGTASLRKGLQAGHSLAEMARTWEPRLATFLKHRKAALLYS